MAGALSIPARSGTLVVPLEGATATAGDHVEFSNAPSSTVNSTKFIGMLQVWQVDDVVVAVLSEADTDISYIEVAIFLPDGTVLHGSDEDAVLTHRSMAATVPLASEGQGLAPASGTVTIAGTVSKGDVTRDVIIDGDDRVVTTVQHYAAVGSLTLSLDAGRELTLDIAAGDGSFYGFAERTRDGGAAG